jgi:hypothetical protein
MHVRVYNAQHNNRLQTPFYQQVRGNFEHTSQQQETQTIALCAEDPTNLINVGISKEI